MNRVPVDKKTVEQIYDLTRRLGEAVRDESTEVVAAACQRLFLLCMKYSDTNVQTMQDYLDAVKTFVPFEMELKGAPTLLQ